MLPSVLRLELKVARHEVVRVEREVVVRVVFEQEQVVLADEVEDRLAALERCRRSGRVRSSRTAYASGRELPTRVYLSVDSDDLHGIQELRESLAGILGTEVGERVFELGRVEALRVDGYLCGNALGLSELARQSWRDGEGAYR